MRGGRKYRRPISFIRIHVRDAVYCTCRWVLRWLVSGPQVDYNRMYNTDLPNARKILILSIYKKIHSTPGNQNKTGKLAKWGVNRCNCNEKWLPDPLPPPFQNWQIAPKLAKFGARVQYRFRHLPDLPENWQKNWQTHTSLQSHKHQKRCPPAAPSGTTGGTTITSETRKNPSR